MDPGINRRGGDNAERCCQREVVTQRFNAGRADDGGQCQGGLQHGEVIADTRPWSAAERQVLPATAALERSGGTDPGQTSADRPTVSDRGAWRKS